MPVPFLPRLWNLGILAAGCPAYNRLPNGQGVTGQSGGSFGRGRLCGFVPKVELDFLWYKTRRAMASPDSQFATGIACRLFAYSTST